MPNYTHVNLHHQFVALKPCSDERQNGLKSLKLKVVSSYNHLLLHVKIIVFVLRH